MTTLETMLGGQADSGTFQACCHNMQTENPQRLTSSPNLSQQNVVVFHLFGAPQTENILVTTQLAGMSRP